MSDIRCEICETTIYNCTCEDDEVDETELCENGECDHPLHCLNCGNPAADWSEQNYATDDTLCQDEEFCVDCCECPVRCKDGHSWAWDDFEVEGGPSESRVELLVECEVCDRHAHFEYSSTGITSSICEN